MKKFKIGQWVKATHPDNVSKRYGYEGKIFQIATLSVHHYHSVNMRLDNLPGLYDSELTVATKLEILEAKLSGVTL